MPKNAAERVRNYLAKKRLSAREAGLCTRCCKEKPKADRSICASCNASATERVRRKRARDRESTQLQHVAVAHERAGDIARNHYLYADASQHYRDALNVFTLAPADRARISEKLAYALSSDGSPTAAAPLFDHIFASQLDNLDAAKKIEILGWRAWQLWLDARTEDALHLYTQAVAIADGDGTLALHKIAYLRMCNYLQTLSRYEEAQSFLHKVGEVSEADSVSIQVTYYIEQAKLAAAFGRAAEAFQGFEQALHGTKGSPNAYHAIVTWDAFGYWAALLGNIELAKTCREHALLLARQFHIRWYIPFLCLNYADTLFRMGQHRTAYEYLIDALSYGAHAPVIALSFAEVGIPIALHMRDEKTLAQCRSSSAIDIAFRSGEPNRIATIASVFAQWYANDENEHEAQALLHRAAEALDSVEQLEQIWTFPLAVAQYGTLSDMSSGRRLLENRAALPCPNIAQACLALFDAYVAKRNGSLSGQHRHAMDAAERFRELNWYGYANRAHALLPASLRVMGSALIDHGPFTSVLTTREQQVAELVLKGLTNREIANELSIAKYTVDSHISSIMNRLGIRSRYQLADTLPQVK